MDPNHLLAEHRRAVTEVFSASDAAHAGLPATCSELDREQTRPRPFRAARAARRRNAEPHGEIAAPARGAWARRGARRSPTWRSRTSRKTICTISRPSGSACWRTRISADLQVGADADLVAELEDPRPVATRCASDCAPSSCSRSTAPAGRRTRSVRTTKRAERSSTSKGVDTRAPAPGSVRIDSAAGALAGQRRAAPRWMTTTTR